MEDVSLADAKEQLDELVARAVRGEVVHITDPKLGRVTLAAGTGPESDASVPKRIPGRLKGILPPPPDDFFDPLSAEELKDWYGDDP